MPTYQYRCTECGGELEAVQKFTDDPLTVHEDCGGRLRKVFSPVGIVFKGSGFYRTDSRKGLDRPRSPRRPRRRHGSSADSSSSSSGGGDKSGQRRQVREQRQVLLLVVLVGRQERLSSSSSSSSSSPSKSSAEKVA